MPDEVAERNRQACKRMRFKPPRKPRAEQDWYSLLVLVRLRSLDLVIEPKSAGDQEFFFTGVASPWRIWETEAILISA